MKKKAYLVMSRRQLLQALKALDKNRTPNEMEMSDCVIIDGDIAQVSGKWQFGFEKVQSAI